VLVLIGLCLVIGGLLAYTIVRRGLSARAEPSQVETILAQTMRRAATPAAVRNRPNPVQKTDAVLDEALEHFADHCAVCHGNDGRGDTAMGRGLYPKAPDLRAAETQSLTDGEIFSIIENGVRLTGMPAWGDGTDEGERSSWALVHFIRHLPALTSDELDRMAGLNPKTPADIEEQEQEKKFLEGGDAPQSSPAHEHHGHGR
jgi:mono/diheme cytochrome c family protein